jgi:hypothetical protein
MNRARLTATVAVVAGVVAWATTFGHDNPDAMGPLIRRPGDLTWADAPASLPPGAKVAVLEGDPAKPGPFVMRMKFPDGYRVAPHTHPRPERVTVLAGALHIGMGATFDAAKCQPMRAGTYGTWPAGMQHFGWFEGETAIQLHGEGPWVVTYVNPADDPRTKTK